MDSKIVTGTVHDCNLTMVAFSAVLVRFYMYFLPRYTRYTNILYYGISSSTDLDTE